MTALDVLLWSLTTIYSALKGKKKQETWHVPHTQVSYITNLFLNS